jgi:hypothetical protein
VFTATMRAIPGGSLSNDYLAYTFADVIAEHILPIEVEG